jgi:hypothetical protein
MNPELRAETKNHFNLNAVPHAKEGFNGKKEKPQEILILLISLRGDGLRW